MDHLKSFFHCILPFSYNLFLQFILLKLRKQKSTLLENKILMHKIHKHKVLAKLACPIVTNWYLFTPKWLRKRNKWLYFTSMYLPKCNNKPLNKNILHVPRQNVYVYLCFISGNNNASGVVIDDKSRQWFGASVHSSGPDGIIVVRYKQFQITIF